MSSPNDMRIFYTPTFAQTKPYDSKSFFRYRRNSCSVSATSVSRIFPSSARSFKP
nr:MAG TPA: Carbamoyl phosphate synthetase [Caudoviricetes sp.]